MTRITLLTALPLFLFLTACTPTASVKIKKPEKFQYGETVGNRYTNPYFGLSFTAPKGWQQQQFYQDKTENPLTAELFQVWQYPLDSGFADDANIYLFAERKSRNPAASDEDGYLLELRGGLKMIGHTDEEISAIRNASLGGKAFRTMTVKTVDEENDLETTQEYFVRLIKDYWLVIIETTYYEEDKAIIDNVLKRLKVN